MRLRHLDREQCEDVRIYRDYGSSKRYVPQLESIFKHHIVHKEEFDEGYSDATLQDTDDEGFEQYQHPARD